MEAPAKQAMTMNDVAIALQVSLMTVRRMVKNGELKGTRVGRLWRCTQQDVSEVMTRRNVATRRPSP